MSRHLHLTVFQLLVRCVHRHGPVTFCVHGLRSLNQWLWVHLQIVSLRVSQPPSPSLMGLLTSTENKCFQKWKHRVEHDKQTSIEKHPMACTRKSLRLDRATWGGTPSCIQGGDPCYTQGVNCADCWSRAPVEVECFHMQDGRGHSLVSSQSNATLTHSFIHQTNAIKSCPSVHQSTFRKVFF